MNDLTRRTVLGAPLGATGLSILDPGLILAARRVDL